jgi:hypothetical protein
MIEGTGEVHKFLRVDADDLKIGHLVCGERFSQYGRTAPHAEFEAAPKCVRCFPKVKA